MEHLDLAGYMNTPVTWNLSAFEQQDAIYLSSSRQMLEPIMEETSEDEEHAQNSWNGYDRERSNCGGFWSSAESETGSVIRVEINKDIDAMSERDFACPPKRARRCTLDTEQPHSLEDVVQLRRPPPPRYDAEAHNSLERFLALEAASQLGQVQRHSTGSNGGRTRGGGGGFDDFYSDNESYHSLSRSSSLVQFESLERQLTLQEQHQSMNSLGNSSPSLLSIGSGCGSGSGSHSNPDSRRGSASSLLKRYESSDGRLHQTYFELNKLDLEEQQRELFGACKSGLHQAELKSDSESSSSSSSSSDSSGHSLLSACPGKQDGSGGSGGNGGSRRLPLNSAENLSEDSGYGEPSTLRRTKSKSIPKNFDKLCEEEEEQEEQPPSPSSPLPVLMLEQHAKNGAAAAAAACNDLCQTKIETPLASGQTMMMTTTTTAATATTQQSPLRSPSSSINSCERVVHSPSSSSPSSSCSSRSPSLSPSPSPSGSAATTSASSVASFTWLRNSLPDIREPRGSSSSHSTFPTDNYNNNNNKGASNCSASASTSCTSASASACVSSSSPSSSTSGSPVLARSVPNELQQLGRQRRRPRPRPARNCHSSEDAAAYSSSEDLDQFDCHSLPRMRRSCSWNERPLAGGAAAAAVGAGISRTRSAAGTTAAGGAGAGAGAGYLNASYHNLTLLDYTDRSENCKRNSGSFDMEKRKRLGASEDYEHIICKGNFLLDELSQIYDKNASILTDKTAAEEEEVEQCEKLSSLSKSLPDEDDVDSSVTPSTPPAPPPEVQHVQLTIRKPPARQKRVTPEQASPSASPAPAYQSPAAAAGVISFSSFGKTFDQDPTNLRTSYAQSLEQCNIQAELSTPPPAPACAVRALPKRRFQSTTAKQRSLVSSTPNLSAFDGGQHEAEDDIYVSSAHTSMHQLNSPSSSQPKPLGILLPAGSRNSFSKEVSFCPVVSKYCWQEQSSEEPQEEHSGSSDDEQLEEEDDEANAMDATVMFNTKENENIAARYNAEQQRQQQQQREAEQQQREAEQQQREAEQQQQESQPEAVREPVSAIENIADYNTTTTTPQPSELKTSPPSPALPQPASVSSVAAAVSLETRVDANPSYASPSPSPSTSPSIAKSITSTAVPTRPLSLHLPILSEPPTNRAHHILYASQQLLQRYDDNDHDREDDLDLQLATDRDSAYTVPSASCSRSSSVNMSQLSNNNIEVTPPSGGKQQRANKSDEKHPSSKGFLSRFAHGLRFSLRRKKKQQQQQQQQQQQLPTAQHIAVKQNGKTQDYVYIPLKPPPGAAAAAAAPAAAAEPIQKLVTGKPPLPKQPPPTLRPAHASAKAQSAAQPPASTASSAAHASHALLSAERQQYAAFARQLNADHRQRQAAATMRETETVSNNGIAGASTADAGLITDSPSRASVAQKTQMFNQLGANSAAAAHSTPTRPLTMVTAVPVEVSPMGLIETNLDTHETVISGKTRSLMDITCNPMLQLPHKHYLVKRLNIDGDEHQNDDDDDDDDNENVEPRGQRIKTSSHGGGVQIATMRRPHKSMEFLLDKENQKNVLPPENELQKSHDHNPAALSEHQLRVQASLQRLNIPDWFRQYNQNSARSPDGASAAASGTTGGYKPGNFTRKRTQDSGRWQGLNSKTTSLSSLGSQRSDRSPLLLSPSAHSHHGGQSSSASGAAASQHGQHGPSYGGHGHGQTGVVGATRWSTSHLNSSQTSPSVSQRGSFARGVPINSSFMSVASGSSAGNPGGVLRNSYRQPYLGWRSTEKLSQRTPHERLANSLLAQRTSPTTSTPANGVRLLQPVTPEIQSSIKEVTSAIVHYVNDQTQAQAQHQQQQQQHSRSASPNSRKCWLESSFVGSRPLDSPQTPVIDSSSSPPTSQQQLDAAASGQILQQPLRMNGLSRVGGGGGESTIYI